MKRRLLLFSAMVLVAAILTTGTMAYVQIVKKAKPTITAGTMQLEVLKTGAAGGETVELFPGDITERTLTVKNTGTNPFYVRVKLSIEGTKEELSTKNSLLMDVNTTDWTSRDGYYYYNEPLQAGETAEPLFTKVQINGAVVDKNYLGTALRMDVDVDAVQSIHNGSTALEAAGWANE